MGNEVPRISPQNCMVCVNMRTVLSFHDDFQNENTLVEHFIIERGHKCFVSLGTSEVYTNFTLPGLSTPHPTLDSVSTENNSEGCWSTRELV